MLTSIDLEQIKKKGSSVKLIEDQLLNFKHGFPFINLSAPATIENKGVIKMTDDEIIQLNKRYDHSLLNREVTKFVPASGAASRMFKSLFAFLDSYDRSEMTYADFVNDTSFNSIFNFISCIQKFAFYNDLKRIMHEHHVDIEDCLRERKFDVIVDYLLTSKGLNYAALPKGLLKFHQYGNTSRTAIEEHLVEAAEYCRDASKCARLHFTLSPEHIVPFNNLISHVVRHYEQLFDVSYVISYSIQKPSTDTIAVDLQNNPFREKDGSLLFRPGGHGALIENLNDLKGDIIFVKNIDNVVPDRLKPENNKYKKALAGYLITLQEQIHRYLLLLNENDVSDELIAEMIVFSETTLHLSFSHIHEYSHQDKVCYLMSLFNRPIRVCGMVKNVGEPGGGPFWVENKNGEISLQIVESSQIDMNNPIQKEIFSSSSHFNPVDLVCGVKDYQGNHFDLLKYIDPETGFISCKSKDGKELKALELPGLWNGAMANWITVFVEVPIITFTPVKVVNDLLRDEHQ